VRDVVPDSSTRAPSVVDVIAQVLSRWRTRVALVDVEKDQSWTYAELEQAVTGWRAFFRTSGLQVGDGVAMFSDNCPQIIPAMLGVISAGLRYTALHPLSSVDDLRFIIDDADVDTLLFHDGFRVDDRLELQRQLPQLQLVDIEKGSGLSVAEVPYQEVEEDAIAMLTYTGGTTGRPKGVIQTHRVVNQCFLMELADWPWPRAPRFLTATPLSHGARQIVLPVLWSGGTLIVTSHIRKLGELVRRHQVDATFLVPSILYRILDGEYGPDEEFASLKMVIYGGGPISPDRLSDAVDRYGQIFTQLYGQAEAPTAVATLRSEDHDPTRPHLFASCGRPTPTTVVELLDEKGAAVPPGEVGEICVRGRLVMAGYWKRPDETERALAGGWLHTGDLAVRDSDGYLYIVDRKKDMIITGGSNVFSREIEDALMSHADVLGAAVVGLADPTWGEAVTAAVVRRPDAVVTQDQLKEFVRRKKGPVNTPKTVIFLDALPLTSLGKPDKRQVSALLEAALAPTVTGEYNPPTNHSRRGDQHV
jgi:fatty-acyl-CoA synthase